MLGLAKRTKAKIFQASTSEVYGDPDIHPQPEHYWGNVNPIGPRSCYYVDDMIEGFVRHMGSPDDLCGPVNLASPGEFSMIELAETILDLTGSRSSLVHEPLPQDDPKQR